MPLPRWLSPPRRRSRAPSAPFRRHCLTRTPRSGPSDGQPAVQGLDELDAAAAGIERPLVRQAAQGRPARPRRRRCAAPAGPPGAASPAWRRTERGGRSGGSRPCPGTWCGTPRARFCRRPPSPGGARRDPRFVRHAVRTVRSSVPSSALGVGTPAALPGGPRHPHHSHSCCPESVQIRRVPAFARGARNACRSRVRRLAGLAGSPRRHGVRRNGARRCRRTGPVRVLDRSRTGFRRRPGRLEELFDLCNSLR